MQHLPKIRNGIQRSSPLNRGESAQEIVREFLELWNSDFSLSYDDFFRGYSERYQIIKNQKRISKQGQISYIDNYKLKPNGMQVDFITNLRKIVASGEKRALLKNIRGEKLFQKCV